MDDPEIIAKHLPELSKLSILKGYTDDGKEILEEPKNKITLKMLLTHSSGTLNWNPIVDGAKTLKDWHTDSIVSLLPGGPRNTKSLSSSARMPASTPILSPSFSNQGHDSIMA
jgi:CubicO group peptidase (beta-lactamase class C family)